MLYCPVLKINVSAAFRICAGVKGAPPAVANRLQSSIYLKMIATGRCGGIGCVSFAVFAFNSFVEILP